MAAAQRAIQRCAILGRLQPFSPTIVSTIMVGLDIEQSDIDIICHYQSQEAFSECLHQTIAAFTNTSCVVRASHVVGTFEFAGFLFEIYGSPIEIEQQNGYRHYQIMQRLVRLGGPSFQSAIRALKRAGHKTEPAIAIYLNLSGDPYQAVLNLKRVDSRQLTALVQTATKQKALNYESI